jgi:hypothetical protein
MHSFVEVPQRPTELQSSANAETQSAAHVWQPASNLRKPCHCRNQRGPRVGARVAFNAAD